MAMRSLSLLVVLSFVGAVLAAAHVDKAMVRVKDLGPIQRVVISSHDPRSRASPTEYLRVGTLQQIYGPNAAFSTLQFNAWKLFLGRSPVLNINGAPHGVQLVVYVDGTNVEDGSATTTALTETLIFEDAVHILATPFQSNSLAMIIAAETHGVPCINEGFYDASFYPPFTWTLYMLPKLQNLGVACVSPLTTAGAKTYAFQTEGGGGFIADIWRGAIAALGGTIILEQNVTEAMKADPTLYDPLIEALKKADPDVLIGTTGGGDGVSTEIDRVHRFRVKGYSPRAFVAYGVGSYPSLRAALGFEAGGLMISEAYQASLAQLDPYWGSSQGYDSAYRAAYGEESSNTDAAIAGTCTLFVAAFNNTITTLNSSSEVMARMTAVNTSSIFGPIFFVNNTVQRPLYCFQNSRNASVVNTVWPESSSAYTPVVYPFLIEYPKGWFSKFSKKKDKTLTIALSVTFGVIGLIVIIALVFIFVIRRKFHIVALKKTGTKDMSDTWG